MTAIAFFNSKGGVGKTTLVYHLAHMLVELGRRVLIVDLDPQSSLTAMCVSEQRLQALWEGDASTRSTVLGCVQPFSGDLTDPHVESLGSGLGLVPGDLGLSRFEERLCDAWSGARDRDEAALRTLSTFHLLIRRAAAQHQAELVLLDVGPNLGAINRATLLAADHLVAPLAPDLFSMQGLRDLGPTLIEWRASWKDRLGRNAATALDLPGGAMSPLGYFVMQSGMRLERPVRTYEHWIRALPAAYHRELVCDGDEPHALGDDPYCLGIVRQHQGLMPLALDARKPMFMLKPADGAIGAHAQAVARCREDYRQIAETLLARLALRE